MTQNNQNTPGTTRYSDKIALAAGSLALLPMGAQAGVIHVTGSPVSLGLSSALGDDAVWDIDGAGGFNPVGRLVHWSYYSGDWSGIYFDSVGFGFAGMGFVAPPSTSDSNDVQQLPIGFRVAATLPAYFWGAASSNSRTPLHSTTNSLHRHDEFIAGDQYLGFRFTDGVNLFYGWSKWTVDMSSETVTISEWAYNDTADGAICVGETSGPGGVGCAVPEPGTLSLALLGAGAGGLRAWRKRRQARALAA